MAAGALLKTAGKALWNFISGNAGAAAGAVASYKQAQLEAQVARENTDKTIAANKAMAEYQYSKDLEMWNMGNRYNSPEAQMQRLKGAGLNPALVYGQGAVGNAAGTLPKYNAPTLEYNYKPPTDPARTIETFMNLRMQQAQVNNAREQNRVLRETADQKAWINQFTPAFLTDRNVIQSQKRWQAAAMNPLILQDQQMRNQWLYGTEKEFPDAFSNKHSELMQTQLSFNQARNARIAKEMENMTKQGKLLDAKTDYQNKVNEWYLTKLFTGLGLNAVKTIGNFFPAAKAVKTFQTAGQSLNRKAAERRFNETTRRMQQFGN